MVGIVSYGTYIPRYRLKVADIARAWKKDPQEVEGSLGVVEKSVAGIDEDAVTIAISAALAALTRTSVKPEQLEAMFVGSESHPYAVNPTSTIVGELLGVGNHYLAADLEFACKAATAGIQAIAALVNSEQIEYGMAIGTDTAQSKPHDALEYTSAAAAAAILLGKEKGKRQKAKGKTEAEVIAELLSYTSYSSDTPDFWRRDGIRFPTHAGRFTGEPAYFTHVLGAARHLLAKSNMKPENIDYCVFHMPNARFPRDAAKRLGFRPDQLAPSLTVDRIGNPYSASALLGLAAVLDIAKPGQTIFMVSYGSGAGSDAFLWKTTAALPQFQMSNDPTSLKLRGASKFQMNVQAQIKRKTYIDYVEYLKRTHKI